MDRLRSGTPMWDKRSMMPPPDCANGGEHRLRHADFGPKRVETAAPRGVNGDNGKDTP